MFDIEYKRRITSRVFWASLIIIIILIYVAILKAGRKTIPLSPADTQFIQTKAKGMLEEEKPVLLANTSNPKAEINALQVLSEQENKAIADDETHHKIGMEEIENFDGTKSYRHKTQPTSPLEFDNLHFMTIAPSLQTLVELEPIRFLVGSLHMLRKGRNQVPHITIFTATLLKDIPKDIYEEITWWNRVNLRNIQEFLALPLTNLPPTLLQSSNSLRWSIMQQMLPETGHIIWIHHEMVFEPARIAVYRAENALNSSALLKAYELGRQAMMKLYAQMEQIGTIRATLPDTGLYYSNNLPVRNIQPLLAQPGEVVMEGYTMAMIKLLENQLECQLVKKSSACLKVEEQQFTTTNNVTSAQEMGIFPFDSSSQASCMIEVRESSFKSQLLSEIMVETPLTTKALEMLQNEETTGKALRRVALALPTTSKGMKKDVEEWPVFLRILLPSFLSTVTEIEWQKTLFTIYVGFDHGDVMFESIENQARYLTEAARLINNRPAQIKFLRLPNIGRVALLWNMLYLQALRDGAQYFYQVNDDLTMVTPGWLTYFTSTLDAAHGFGVVGPADYHNALNCSILTQAMVTSVHYEIFGSLYPLELKDWKTDRWLTYIYQPDHMYCRGDVVANNGGAPTRYKHCEFKSYVIYVDAAKRRLAEWLKEHSEILLSKNEDNIAVVRERVSTLPPLPSTITTTIQ